MATSKPSQSSGAQQPTHKVVDVIGNFAPTRVSKLAQFMNRFVPSTNPSSKQSPSITSLDFDDSGELALVAQDDETIQIYNCKEGKHAKELKSHKYGADVARFAHHPQSVIYASTKGDGGFYFASLFPETGRGYTDSIRYLSTHDNSYIRYFRGHTGPVTCISLSPATDEFLSASLDSTVRLWDMRSQHPQGQLNLHEPYLAVYDPTATVIAIACPLAQYVLLYDVRNYDKGPFAVFDVKDMETKYRAQESGGAGGNGNTNTTVKPPNDWTILQFSNDGQKLLIGTNGPGHFVLDAFSGSLLAWCARPMGNTNRTPPSSMRELRDQGPSGAHVTTPSTTGDVTFTPDGAFLVGGSGESGLYVWDLNGLTTSSSKTEDTVDTKMGGVQDEDDKTLQPSQELGAQTKHIAGKAAVVGYNPRHNLLVTGDKGVVIWLPDMD
ncbi:MAG: member of Set1p complex, histone methyl transferase [Alyxoria varia]|nr:MAG: member of Set1p complex, histone methyl transferase [Alyxoria varia]